MKSRHRMAAILSISAAALGAFAWIPESRGSVSHEAVAPYRALLVGGGPDIEHNQVAIESNIRYLTRLLPVATPWRVLFTDGNPASKNVLCQDGDKKPYYRVPEIPRIDGPSDLDHVKAELSKVAGDLNANPSGSALLYFTGHGSPNGRSEYNNNRYDLWDNKGFSVKTFAESLKEFPKSTPIALVMVECYSGSFGNVIFQDGDPKAPLADLNICGFFASVAQRQAAGCTPEINEANYRDFTSFFFAALSGTDRLGHPVTGADYNHDGKVGMNEAFAYALIHDDSIDTPVCTSDVFLRRYVVTPEKEVVSTPYSQVLSWASKSQLAVLDALSKNLNLSGEDRVSYAYDEFRKATEADPQTGNPRAVHMIRFIRMAKSVILAHILQTGSDEVVKARYAALVQAESANPLR